MQQEIPDIEVARGVIRCILGDRLCGGPKRNKLPIIMEPKMTVPCQSDYPDTFLACRMDDDDHKVTSYVDNLYEVKFVIELTPANYAQPTIPQLAMCMVGVQQQKQAAKQEDTDVYGVATDGAEFWFAKLSGSKVG